MKAMVMGSLVATLITFQGIAQRGENDDMYFNAKDREKLKVATSANDKIDSDYKAFKGKHFDSKEEQVVTEEPSNPTDSYSARTINPEYIARSNSEQASEAEENYYVDGYTPNATDSYSAGNYNNNYNNNSYNNNYNNNWNNNNWGQSNWYGQAGNMYSPYYGSCNPWMNPYYSGGSGWSMSVTYMWGNGYGGNSYNNPYGYYNPYSYYNPYYSNYGYGNYSYGNYGYPYNSYGNYEYSRPNYGKRPSRNSAIVTPTHRISSSNATNSVNSRSRSASEEYYVKPARRTFENLVNESSTNRYSRPNTTENSKPRSRDLNSSESRPSYSTPSRNNSHSGGSAPSRSSGGSSGSRRRN